MVKECVSVDVVNDGRIHSSARPWCGVQENEGATHSVPVSLLRFLEHHTTAWQMTILARRVDMECTVKLLVDR